MTFLPGQSGNPAGLSKRGNAISDHFRSLIDLPDSRFEEIIEYLERKEKGKRLGRITSARLIACRVIVMARNGNLEATKILLERVEGKVTDQNSLLPSPTINIQTNVRIVGHGHDKLMPGTTLPLLEEPEGGTED